LPISACEPELALAENKGLIEWERRTSARRHKAGVF
jgi:hypothetical protein